MPESEGLKRRAMPLLWDALAMTTLADVVSPYWLRLPSGTRSLTSVGDAKAS